MTQQNARGRGRPRRADVYRQLAIQIIYKRDRARYLRVLRRADAGESGPLGELLARAMLDSLHRFVIPAVAGPARLVPLAALETPGMKASALRAAAERGRPRALRARPPIAACGSARRPTHPVSAIKLLLHTPPQLGMTLT